VNPRREKMLSNFALSGTPDVQRAFDELIAERNSLQAKVSELHRIPWRRVVAMARKLVFYNEKGEYDIADGYVVAVKIALEDLDKSAPDELKGNAE
jgi:hypothetical protein